MSPSLRRVIGWWQLVCGILGVLMLTLEYFDVPNGSRAIIDQYIGTLNIYLGSAFFSLATHAGYRLIRQRPGALGLALACQALQVASFAFLGGPEVQISSGPLLALKVASDQIRFSAGFNVGFFIGTRVQGPSYEVIINFLALAWTIILARAWLNEQPAQPAATSGVS